MPGHPLRGLLTASPWPINHRQPSAHRGGRASQTLKVNVLILSAQINTSCRGRRVGAGAGGGLPIACHHPLRCKLKDTGNRDKERALQNVKWASLKRRAVWIIILLDVYYCRRVVYVSGRKTYFSIIVFCDHRHIFIRLLFWFFLLMMRAIVCSYRITVFLPKNYALEWDVLAPLGRCSVSSQYVKHHYWIQG